MTARRPLLLRGATLINGLSRSPRENAAILIRNGRITAVGSPEELGVLEQRCSTSPASG